MSTSKCYERVEHHTDREDAQRSGCPQDIANTAFTHYAGTRILRAHGAVGPPVTGAHGIIAGCSYAKDILKSFLLPVATTATTTVFRDYVDDITLLAIGDSPHQVVIRLQEDLDRINDQLRGRSMALNDAKEQILGNTAAVRKAWHDLTGKAAVEVVRDLGTYHYGYGAVNPELDNKLTAFKATAARIGILPVPRARRAQIAAAILYGRTLYGAETQPLTQAHFHAMRRLMAASIMGERHTRPIRPFLLHFRDGRSDPEITRMARLISHWTRHGHTMDVPLHYWEECHTLTQKRGPIQLLKNLLRGYHITPTGPFNWTFNGTTYAMDTDPDFLGTMLRQIRHALWQRLNHQEHFQGLDQRRNETATNSLRRSLDQQQVAFLDMVQTDSIYTPWRAHTRWGKTETEHCTMRHAPVAKWAHFVGHCPHIRGRPHLPHRHPVR